MNQQLKDFLRPNNQDNFTAARDDDIKSSYSSYKPYALNSAQSQKFRKSYSNKPHSQQSAAARNSYSGSQRSEIITPNKPQRIYKPRNGQIGEAFKHEMNKSKQRSVSYQPGNSSTINNWCDPNKEKYSQQLNNGSTSKKQLQKYVQRPQSGQKRPSTASKRNYKNVNQFYSDQKRSTIGQNSSIQYDNESQQSIPDHAAPSDGQTQEEDEEKCYQVDYSFLENMSINDPRLQGAYAEEMLNNPNIDIDFLMDYDQDYFHHIFGNCACAKCTCTKCKCKHAKMRLSYKNGFNTSYSKDFQTRSTFSSDTYKTPVLNQTHYSSLNEKQRQAENVDPSFRTTHQQFYVTHKLPKKEPKKEYVPQERPIQKLTSYGSSFANWQEYDPNWIFKAPKTKHTTGHKDKYKTMYGQEFSKNKPAKDPVYENVARKQVQTAYSQPFSQLFNGVKMPTQYEQTMQDNFESNKKINAKFQPSKKVNENTPAYEDQFKTSFQRDFTAKEPFDKSIKEIMRQSQKMGKITGNQWRQTLKSKINNWRKQRSQTTTQESVQLN